MKVHTLFAVICLSLLTPSLFGQTNAPADTNTIAANPIPTGQAPDDVVKKLSDLVHDGKYAEAQQLTAGLLLAYPDDQHLIKAKALLDKLLAAQTPNPTPVVSEPTKNVTAKSAASSSPKPLTGMDRVENDSLIELGREAQQTTDLEQQKTLLQQFMDKSAAFVQKHPEVIQLWQLRAAAALILNDPQAGAEAGQKLLVTSATDGNDPKMRQLLAQLNLKGWLESAKAAANRPVVIYKSSDVDLLHPSQPEMLVPVVDMAKLFNGYWKTKPAQNSLENRKAELRQEIKKMTDDFAKKQNDYLRLFNNGNDQTISAEEREKNQAAAAVKAAEIKTSRDSIDQFQRQANSQLNDLSKHISVALVGDINNAVSNLAQKKKLNLVLDASMVGNLHDSNGNFPWVGTNDVTGEVLNILNANAPIQ